jgi:hypothetical protein
MSESTSTALAAPRKPSLFRIGLDLAALDALLEEAGEGADERDLETVAAFAAELAANLDTKLTGCVAWVKEQEALAKVARDEARRLTDVAAKREAAVKRLKGMILEILQAQGLKRIDTPLGAVRVQANGGTAPVVLDPCLVVSTLPPSCVRTVVEPVKEEIRKRLEAGEVIAGCSLGDRGASVRIG